MAGGFRTGRAFGGAPGGKELLPRQQAFIRCCGSWETTATEVSELAISLTEKDGKRMLLAASGKRWFSAYSLALLLRCRAALAPLASQRLLSTGARMPLRVQAPLRCCRSSGLPPRTAWTVALWTVVMDGWQTTLRQQHRRRGGRGWRRGCASATAAAAGGERRRGG